MVFASEEADNNRTVTCDAYYKLERVQCSTNCYFFGLDTLKLVKAKPYIVGNAAHILEVGPGS